MTLQRLFILTVVLVCQIQSSPKDILIPVLKDLFAYKCLKYGGFEKAQEFMEAAHSYFDCTKSKRMSSSAVAQVHSSFARGCTLEPRSSYECLKQFTDVVEPCLEPQEKYLVGFIHGTYNITSDFVCQGKGDYLRSLNIHSIRFCGQQESKVLAKCLPHSGLMEKFANCDCTIRKPQLCRELYDVSQCISNGLRKQCAHDKRVADFFGATTEVYTVMCSVDDIFGNLVF